ncbi:MAG: signal peptidase I [Steroidobacteraceae bacterium]
MLFDFSLWLLVLTSLFFVIWAIDALLFKAARLRKYAAEASAIKPAASGDTVAVQPYRDPVLVEYARSFYPVLGLVLIVRSFIFEPFRIPSDSMMPTLLNGDFIFVSKFSYDLRMPVFNTKLLETGDPQRGDVVVFKLPSDTRINYIKRLIGLPGDHVRVLNDVVYVNDQKMEVTLDGLYNDNGYVNAQLGEENLGGIKHQVMFINEAFPKDFDGVVPAGRYLFMGDNRDNSQDGRFPQVGYVPEENLVGKAQLIWFHWKFTEMPIFSRIATRIR